MEKIIPLTNSIYHILIRNCHIRGKKFEEEDGNYIKSPWVTNHCHYTDKYRSAASSTCNLKHNIPKEIPVVFCKRSNYDY